MQSSTELIMDRSKSVGSELAVSAAVDLPTGSANELLHSPAITMSLKAAPSPSPVDSSMMGSECDEVDNPNAGLEQALQSFVRYVQFALVYSVIDTFLINCTRKEGRVQLC